MKRLMLLTVLGACAVPPADLGQPCTLVRSDGDGGAEPIPKSDPAIAFAANQDILSFGSTDCSARICVRDRTFQDSPGDSSPNAKGYCSAACGPCGKELTCRELLLDQQTLEALKKSDPAKYKAVFGEATMPSFCARSP